ncbi:sugar diacid recognition domain-containing protein [[Clostridium] colinum]|uniref:sugar diacid recognition domain-containing protein n=1 Tax=[Clostridium] colinum TaxID=36835 RepID=UPI0020259D08|nr:sugar diacid recognition domain-containing protein [[Clostridium] colinum]
MQNISVDLAQKIVDAINQICKYNINFIDKDGIVIASTNQKRINTFNQAGLNAIKTKTTVIVDNDDCYLGSKKGINTPIFINEEPIAVIGVSGEPKEIDKYIFLAIKITEIFLKENILKESLSNKFTQINYIVQTYLYNQKEKYEHTLKILDKLNVDIKTNYYAITIILKILR